MLDIGGDSTERERERERDERERERERERWTRREEMCVDVGYREGDSTERKQTHYHIIIVLKYFV